MTSNPIDETFFVAGGTLKATTPSYVKRPADGELFEAVMDGQLCYVLTPRQMGKSSLMTRTSRHLEEHGIRTASIDLTSIGTQVTASQWYTSIISQLSRRLNLGIDAQEWCRQQEGLAYVQILTAFIEEIILEKISGRVVVFIDEIDSTLSLDFRDDFFAGLRAIYNARTDKPVFERISFVLLGVASPSDLIADRARTPFNIGRAIALQEFDFEHSQVLQNGLDAVYPGQGKPILGHIFHWTNGHPYLTQKLCSEIVERKRESWTDVQIDQLVHELFLSEQARKETNLKFVQDRLLDNPRRSSLLGLYQRILRGKVREEGQSALQNELKLSGLVHAEDGLLKVRNLIYATVFSVKWAQANTPKNWPKIIAATLAVMFFALLSVFVYNFMISILSDKYASYFYDAQTDDERLESLASMFELKGIPDVDYAPRARDLFYHLNGDEQIDLFRTNYATVDKKKYLIPVVRGLYLTMAYVPGIQEDSTKLLTIMNNALKEVALNDSNARKLQEKIDAWVLARLADQNENSPDAINKYDDAVNLDTDNPSLYYERAYVAFKLHLFEKALKDLDTVMALAQKVPTKSNKATLTPPPQLTSTMPSATQISLTSINATSITLTVTPIDISTPLPTPAPTNTISAPRNTSPDSDGYRSSFLSFDDMRSAVSRLMGSGFVFSKQESNKYPNLVSSGVIRPIESTSILPTTKPNDAVSDVYNAFLKKKVIDSSPMIALEGGNIIFGTDSPDHLPEEPILQKVSVASFAIEPFEVTNQKYHICVNVGACQEPVGTDFYDNPIYTDHPVVFVTLAQANAYCAWLGRRLPTTFEWELAARGTQGRKWPWGEGPLSKDVANVIIPPNYLPTDALPVGSLKAGATANGIYDLVGNVWEWTSSFYEEGQHTGYIQRGGSWQTLLDRITVIRFSIKDAASNDVGFRCVQ